MARPTVPTTGPNDTWGVTVNNALFDVSDRVDARVPLDGSNKIDYAYLPANSVIASPTTTRPTARTDIVVLFVTATDPGANALDNDIWVSV